MRKMPIFKPRVGKVFFRQTIGRQNVISPFFKELLIIRKNSIIGSQIIMLKVVFTIGSTYSVTFFVFTIGSQIILSQKLSI